MKLWIGQSISVFGTPVSQIAIPWIAIKILDASAFEVATLTTFEFLPFLLFALPAGVWVDRLPRRSVLIAGDIGRALLLATIPLAYVLDALTLGRLYVVGFLVGILTVFFDVAYQAYLPSLVARDQLVEGNSKLQLTASGAQIAGPAAGGGLVQALTAPYAVLADAISFVQSLQGRMNAVMRFFVWGTIPLGSLVGGALASQIGLRATLFVGAFGGMLAILPIVLSPIPALREFPEQEPELFEPAVIPPCPCQTSDA